MSADRYIVDDIGTVIEAMKADESVILINNNKKLQYGEEPNDVVLYWEDVPYYMYGHKMEIAARLLEKGKDSRYEYQRYPLIALRLDTPEEKKNGMIMHTLNIAILDMTDAGYTAEQRYANVIKPVLTPLYKSFLRHLKLSGLFTWSGNQEEPPHVKIDRPFWGTSQANGNTANIFSDPLDAIELLNLKINQPIK
jgi:hypothetical protein